MGVGNCLTIKNQVSSELEGRLTSAGKLEMCGCTLLSIGVRFMNDASEALRSLRLSPRQEGDQVGSVGQEGHRLRRLVLTSGGGVRDDQLLCRLRCDPRAPLGSANQIMHQRFGPILIAYFKSN